MEESSGSNLSESTTIEKSKVLFSREWSFWENYETKNREEKDYSKLTKELYTFNNIIAFWQFWNSYPGNDIKNIFYDGEYFHYFFKEKYRIVAMNIFQKGIRPEWEDEKNKKGHIFILGYDPKSELDKFLYSVTNTWIKLIINLIGEQLPYTDKINGIRFVDKTKLGRAVTFKFEVWVNSSMNEKEIEQLKNYFTNNFCSGTIVKDIS
jgi:hypothetical protein